MRNKRRTDEEWLSLIQQCRSSGFSDRVWYSYFLVQCRTHFLLSKNRKRAFSSFNWLKFTKNQTIFQDLCSIVIRDSRFVNEFHILKATCKFCTRLSTFVMTFPFFPLLL